MNDEGSARTFAQHLGHSDVARLLQLTPDEEKETDKRLTELTEQELQSQDRNQRQRRWP
jgi:ferritin-like metal-binding protein YciE